MGFFDDLLEGLLSPRGIMTLIPAAASLAGSLFAKPPKTTTTQAPRTTTTTTESPMLRELLAKAQGALPQPLSEEDIAREAQLAGAGGLAKGAGRGLQVPGYPYAGNLANTISAEAMLGQRVGAQRFNREQAGRNVSALTAMGAAAPRTTTEAGGGITQTAFGPPKTFENLAGVGKSLGELFPTPEEERKRKAAAAKPPPYGMFNFEGGLSLPGYP